MWIRTRYLNMHTVLQMEVLDHPKKQAVLQYCHKIELLHFEKKKY